MLVSCGRPPTSFFSPGADFSLILNSFGQPLGYFGTPWDTIEVALACPEAFNLFPTKLSAQFRANGSQVDSLRRKMASLNSAATAAGTNHIHTKCRIGRSSAPPFTRAGARMREFRTNSRELEILILK